MWLGLAKRRTLILPSWKGWLILLALVGAFVLLVMKGAYPYLAADSRLPQADVVLVEGWVSDSVIEKAKEELDAGRCTILCTSGVDLERGSSLSQWRDWATLAGESLKAMGVPEDKVLIVPGGTVQRQRTYVSFRKAKEALLERFDQRPLRINVVSEGPHGLRSTLVARKIFGDDAEIGMIPIAPVAYDHTRWWKSSSGIKAIFMELVGSTYERFADSGR